MWFCCPDADAVASNGGEFEIEFESDVKVDAAIEAVRPGCNPIPRVDTVDCLASAYSTVYWLLGSVVLVHQTQTVRNSAAIFGPVNMIRLPLLCCSC